jgi:hypothetical protein
MKSISLQYFIYKTCFIAEKHAKKIWFIRLKGLLLHPLREKGMFGRQFVVDSWQITIDS